MTIKHIAGERGFSYIEIILTVTIILSLGLLSTGFYSGYLLRNTASNTKDEIIQVMRKAQMYAVSGKYGNAWGINYISGSVYLFKGDSFSSRDTRYDELYPVSDNINISGLSEMYFNKNSGIPSTSLAVTITGGDMHKQIAVSAQGGISD